MTYNVFGGTLNLAQSVNQQTPKARITVHQTQRSCQHVSRSRNDNNK